MRNHQHILLLITLLVTDYVIIASSRDIIAPSCRRCAAIAPSLSYDFCVASLQSVPVSRFVDIRGLALISMELALINATDTISTVKRIINGGRYDHDTLGLACLKNCLGWYDDAASALLRGVGDFMAGKFKGAGVLVSGVMEMPRKCEDGFEKGGEICPLKRENYDLVQLCDIALCLVGILSFGQGESVL